ncbi:MAG: hypothetical protein AB1352_05180 [Patescibacteria group bacterium]
MKKLILLGLLWAKIVLAQGYTEAWIEPTAIHVEILGGDQKLFNWVVIDPVGKWAEFYFGPNLNLGPVILSPGLGIETSPTIWRMGCSASLETKNFFGLLVSEAGGSGFFWRTIAQARQKDLRVGVMGETNRGWGPRVDLSGKRFNVFLFKPLLGGKPHRVVGGLKYTF